MIPISNHQTGLPPKPMPQVVKGPLDSSVGAAKLTWETQQGNQSSRKNLKACIGKNHHGQIWLVSCCCVDIALCFWSRVHREHHSRTTRRSAKGVRHQRVRIFILVRYSLHHHWRWADSPQAHHCSVLSRGSGVDEQRHTAIDQPRDTNTS